MEILDWKDLLWRERFGKRPSGPPSIDWRSDRVAEQIGVAHKRLCSINVEEAYWILIPPDESIKPLWVSAMGRRGDISARIRLPDQVRYNPRPAEKKQLLDAMRLCSWVLHVHNHPPTTFTDGNNHPDSSVQDELFAGVWRDSVPELGDRLRFFVICGATIVEYLDKGAIGTADTNENAPE